jgi:RNA binding exosome subunit
MVFEGYHGNPITLFSATIKRKPDTKAFAAFVRPNMTPEDVELLREEMPDRLDDDQMFHLRFDKQAAFNGLVYTLCRMEKIRHKNWSQWQNILVLPGSAWAIIPLQKGR